MEVKSERNTTSFSVRNKQPTFESHRYNESDRLACYQKLQTKRARLRDSSSYRLKPDLKLALHQNKPAKGFGSAAIWSYVLSAAFILLWSSGWVGAKFGLGYSGPFTFLAIRYALVVVVLSVIITVLCFVKSLSRISTPEFVIHALVGFLSHGIYLAGSIGAMSFGASAGLVAFLSAMQPLFTTVCAGWILREGTENANPLQWLGILLGIGAIYLTLANDIQRGGSLIAYLMLFISVSAISIATLIDRRVTKTRKALNLAPTHLIQILWVHSASALILFLALGWFLEGFETHWSAEYAGTLIYMACVVSIASYGLMYLLLRRMSAINVSSLIYLTPPTTMLLAWPILGESISLGDVLGLIVGGLAVVLVLCCSKPGVNKPTFRKAANPFRNPFRTVANPVARRATRQSSISRSLV